MKSILFVVTLTHPLLFYKGICVLTNFFFFFNTLFLLTRENINTSVKYATNIPKMWFGTHSSESEWLVQASSV